MTVGLLLIVAVSGGIYLNYQLDRVVKSLSRPGILFTDAEPGAVADDIDTDNTVDGSSKYTEPGSSSIAPGKMPGQAQSGSSSSGTLNAGANGAIVNGVQQKVDRPIENKDMLKAGLIILQRLDSNEISYLFRVGSQDNYSKEDLQQVQKVLKAKLTDKDVEVLKTLGEKYGKRLRVLDEEEIK